MIAKLLQDLCEYANTNYENVNYIHPFLDGNGRTARVLFYWCTVKHGYENLQYIPISALLKKKVNDYGRAYIKT
ncbi:MAG: Fic family protein [Colwellia sp.]|nr:Fic family protein [Colwellia sp.]